MRYTRWITNCTHNDSFEYLVRYSKDQPDKHFNIGPPYPVGPHTSMYYLDIAGSKPIYIDTPGFTTEQLENMGLCGLYECEI
jgi:hypothetical protein